MKLMKKVIAAAAALAMTMTSMTGVFADTIDGGAVSVNTTVYKVTLPTTAGMSFTLDPQGLLTAQNGAFGTEGLVTSAGVMVAKNESSVDVKFSAKFYVECATSTSVVAASSSSDLDGSTTKEAVCLQIGSDQSLVASAVAVSTTPVAVEDAIANAVDIDKTTSATAVAAIDDVTMTKASYVLTGDAASGFDYVKDPAKDDATFLYMAITGQVNPKADWSAYSKGTKTIKLNAVFGFKDAATNEEVGSHALTKLPNGNYACDSIKTSGGQITTLTVDGVDRFAAVEKGYFVYNVTAQRFAVKGEWPLIPVIGNGDHTVEVTLDGQAYTLDWTIQ